MEYRVLDEMTTIKHQIKKTKVNSKPQDIVLDIFYQHIEDMVFVMEIDSGPVFRYFFANASALKLAKIPADCLGRTLQEVLPAETAYDIQCRYEKVVKSKKPITYQDHLIESDSQKEFGETIISPVMNENGEVIYTVGVTRVITASMKEKEKIIESEQIFRSLLDNNMDAIISVDLYGKITHSNPATHSITGLQNEKIVNTSIFDYFQKEYYLKINQLMEESFQGYSTETVGGYFKHSKGFDIQVQIKSVPIIIHQEVKGVYLIIRDMSEQQEKSDKIKYMAFHDQLTGLLNRSTLLNHIQKAIKDAKDSTHQFSLIFMDLDRFKLLNDSFGHMCGDRLLKQVSDRLRTISGKRHTLYRQGGDEFVILLKETSRQDTIRFIKSINAILEQPFQIDKEQYYVTVSMGISMYPFDGSESINLMQKADHALYQVKQRGRAHYLFYSSKMDHDQFPNPFIMDTSLRKAIEKKELSVFYQPQINMRTSEITSFEALLRWNHTKLGFISPADFIPAAEDTGLIISIGEWVLEEVCRQIRDWNLKGYQTRVAVNLSPKQFQQHNIVETIQNCMNKYQIEAKSLEIEITEGTIQDTKEINERLKEMKNLGLSISVDDFGTGYSSLSYLKQFPLNTLKIDRSFISELMTDRKDAAITRTIIQLGHSLGLEVIAEGVETKEQAELLMSIQCEKAQGFYFSKAIPAIEAEAQFLQKTV